MSSEPTQGPRRLSDRFGREPPVDLLLHPVTLVALGLMVLNDGWLRGAHPGWITGKLSDCAAVVAFPGVSAALWGLGAMAVGRVVERLRPGAVVDYSLRWSVVLGCLAITGGVLIGINVSAAARDAYLAALRRLDVFDLFGPLHYTMDPTDLMALVFLPLPGWVAWRLLRRVPAGRLRAALRRAEQQAPSLPPQQRQNRARRIVDQTLRDVRNRLPASREPALDRLVKAVARGALAEASADEPSLAPGERDHYHRIHEALTSHRIPGSPK